MIVKECKIAIYGTGERLGVDTPLCAQIVEMTHGIENGFCEIAYEKEDFLER